MLSGTVSNGPIFLLILSLFDSTMAAIAIARMDRNIPIPILCITLIPFSSLVIILVRGIKILSYNGINMIIEIVIALCRVAGGILKLSPMFLFIVEPCLVKKVAGCWKITAKTRSIVHMGKSRSITFAFSKR